MPEVKIGVVRTRTEITPEGTFQEYYDVEYFIDDARHHVRMLPKGFTAKTAEAAVKAAAAELIAITEKKIPMSK